MERALNIPVICNTFPLVGHITKFAVSIRYVPHDAVVTYIVSEFVERFFTPTFTPSVGTPSTVTVHVYFTEGQFCAASACSRDSMGN